MCGRLNIADPNKLSEFLADFNIETKAQQFQSGRFKRAASTISIVHAQDNRISVNPATWWLLLERTEQGFKPSKYTSFNTRYDKLNKRGSAGYLAYRQSRCIIPVNGFGETKFVNKKPVHYHDLRGVNKPILMAGLYRQWQHPVTGEKRNSCSVITLPAHDKLKHIHPKSTPLMLPHEQSVIDSWLDHQQNSTDIFEYLMQPHIPQDLSAIEIDKPAAYNPIGDEQIIFADQ